MGGEAQAGGQVMTYCIVPRELAAQLHDPLRRHFREDPLVEVIVEARESDRRVGGERRRGGVYAATDRRRVLGGTGRRAGERRAALVPVPSPQLPRRARAHGARLCFVERLEPSGQHAEDLDSARLVRRFQSGELEAFSLLYLRYFDRLYGYLHIALRDRNEAEDAAQQVFMNALEALPRYEERGQPFRAWLFRIARNTLLNRLKREGRLHLVDPMELGRRRELSHESELEPEVLGWITDRELLMFVERLPLAQRQVLLLRYMLGLSSAEAGAILDRSDMDVRRLQHRALSFLRQRLAAVGRTPASDPRKIRMRRRLKPAFVLRERRFALHR